MKNFFKKLAFVLALAMVLVSVAPATANAAAKAPSLKKTSKILYIGGDITGTISDSYRFYFNNAKGYTATWESLNEDVVVIEGKEVVAVGVGKAVVRATLTNKAGNEVVREATVWVKQNAEKVGFGDMKKVESPLPVGQTAKVNVFRQVGDKKIWSQNDMATCTDKIVWTSSDEKVATVDKWGTVTAVGAGEATITATATQPQGPTAGESASYKVTVAAGLTSATQKDLNTANLSFGKVVTEDELKTVKVYQLVGNTKVLQTVDKFTLNSDDKTKATVKLYVDFVKNATYVFEFGDTSKEFVAVDPSVEKVTRIAIEQTVAVKSEETDLKVKLYVGDVDVTTKLADRITLSTDSINCYLNTAKKEITLFEIGKTATVKAVYHTYNYENNVEKTLETSAVITCVDATPINYKETVKFYLSSKEPSSFDFDKDTVATALAAEETKNIAVKIKLTDGKYADTKSNASDFSFTSSDESVLLVNKNTVTGVKDGVATLVIKYKNTIINAVTVTVTSKATPVNVEVTLNKVNLSSYPGANDKVVATVVVKDQLNRPIDTTLAVSPVNPSTAPVVDAKKVDTGKYEFVFTTALFANVADGTCQYKLTANANIIRYFNFSVNDTVDKAGETAKVSSYQLSVDKTSVDTGFVVDATKNTSKDVKINLMAVASNGYKIADVNFTTKADAETAAKVAEGAKGFYYAVETPENKTVAGDVTGTYATVTATAGGIAVKAKTGTYKVTAYMTEYSKTAKEGFITRALDVKFFNVADTQMTGIATPKSNTTSGKTVVEAVNARDFIDVKFDGKEINIDSAEIAGTDAAGNTVFVYNVIYNATFNLADGYTINGQSTIVVPVKIVVNRSITLNN